ncbi:MAG TPA: prepilin-type N-terminal cleavage/methylation domain-containing protein [Jatrophihabitans sp.]|jgi:Tfp pilus assembly protein PilE
MFRHRHDDRGETLLELVVTIAILGVCVVGIGAGIALSVKISSIHRDQATADAFLHNYAESIQTSYTTCASSTTYSSGLPTPNGFASPTSSVKFWNGAAFTNLSPCTSASDPGLQQVTLNLNSTDGFTSESLVVVLRKST